MKRIVALTFVASNVALAQQSSLTPIPGDDNLSPTGETSSSPGIPGDAVLPSLDQRTFNERVDVSRAAVEEVKREASAPAAMKSAGTTAKRNEPQAPQQKRLPLSKNLLPVTANRVADQATGAAEVFRIDRGDQSITIFSRNAEQAEEPVITLPSGAHAFGTVQFGQEVKAGGSQPVSVKLDYAFLGPNQSVVALNECIIWINVSADFNANRVMGEAQDLTCKAPSGRVFTVPMTGPMVGAEKEYAGTESDLIVRGPAMAAVTDFVQGFTRAYGEAMAAVETTTQVSSSQWESDKATNVTGNRERYMQGKVIEQSASFLDSINTHYKSMAPTLAIAPGTKIHIVNRTNIKVPKAFFRIQEIK